MALSSIILYTQTEAAERLKVNSCTLTNWLRQGKIDPPFATNGRIKLFTAEQIEATRKQMCERGFRHGRNGEKLYSMRETAKLLHISEAHLQRLVYKGDLEAPTRDSPLHPRYSESDISELKNQLRNRVRRKASIPADQAEKQGLLSIVRAAKRLGVGPISVYYRMRKGLMPRPSHEWRGAYYYTVEEVDGFRHLFHQGGGRKIKADSSSAGS
jgi:DNA-binding transcriptional MerR regulator